jgi:hypothetical protein
MIAKYVGWGVVILALVFLGLTTNYLVEANKHQPINISYADKKNFEVVGFSTQKYGENDKNTIAFFQTAKGNGLKLFKQGEPQIIEVTMVSMLVSVRGFRKAVGTEKRIRFTKQEDFEKFRSFLFETSDKVGSCPSMSGDTCVAYVFN